MSEAVARWRLRLFRSAIALMAIEFALYLSGVASVNIIEPVGAKLKAAAWFSVIGTVLSLIVLILSTFGYGWKRIGLAAMCLLSLPFWFGFTLY